VATIRFVRRRGKAAFGAASSKRLSSAICGSTVAKVSGVREGVGALDALEMAVDVADLSTRWTERRLSWYRVSPKVAPDDRVCACVSVGAVIAACGAELKRLRGTGVGLDEFSRGSSARNEGWSGRD
jgi:hypothetical protein